MSLHHGLPDLRNNHFTDSYIFPWFQTFDQASLRFCLWVKLTLARKRDAKKKKKKRRKNKTKKKKKKKKVESVPVQQRLTL